MSQATKRKHVAREVLDERVVPSPRQRIVRVLGTPGNNLHEVETAEGGRFLVSMPPRFRRHIWIKRGDFLLVDPIEEGEKVKAEMRLVLFRDHVRFLQRQGLWPEAFAPAAGQSPRRGEAAGEDGELFVNTNRVGAGDEDTDDTEDDTDDEDTENTDDEDTDDEDTGTTEDTGDSEDKHGDTRDGGAQDTRCP
ncbi:probable RNA-binding protein EIF1AD [Dromaius novaehollandiae]|uniref:probable RNA-binding protein EIF1AD n=1 Tax=Dromaius novaehollandiae TaxID=8790 RepID=UPI0031202390